MNDSRKRNTSKRRKPELLDNQDYTVNKTPLRSSGDREAVLQTIFRRGVLPQAVVYALGLLVAVCLLAYSNSLTGGWKIIFLFLSILNFVSGIRGLVKVSASWTTLRDCAYPNIDANAAETWDLAVWLANSPQFGGTPIRDMRQQELREALDEYGPLFQANNPEDVTIQLNRLERLMHEVDWTGQYVHALLLFRQLKDSHLKYWSQLDGAYRQTLIKLTSGMRLENLREDVQLSPHRMVILDGLQINCGLHGTVGEYTVGYEDGGVL